MDLTSTGTTRSTTSTMVACATWQDHDWSGPRLLEVGRHPTMGNYQRLAVRCHRCGKTNVETRWTDLRGALRAIPRADN